MNPVWHVHNSKVPNENMIMSFSVLLILLKQVMQIIKNFYEIRKKYKSNISEKDYPIFDKLIGYAIKYFNDVIKIKKNIKNLIRMKSLR